MNENRPEAVHQEANERHTEFEDILQQLEPIVNQSDFPEDQLNHFLNTRLEFLVAQSQPTAISLAKNQVYQGFIHPDTDIRRSFQVDSFHVDDPTIYQVLIDTMREFKASTSWKDRSLRQISIPAVQYAIANYFGNAVGNETTEHQNQTFYLDRVTAYSQFVPLQELKGRKIAVCVEKAVAAQNLLAFLGIDATVINSTKCHIQSKEREEAHAYNIFQTDRGIFIYDPANPVKFHLSDNELESISPALYPITSEQFEELKKGGEISVSHTDYSQDQEEVYQSETSERIYAGPSQ